MASNSQLPGPQQLWPTMGASVAPQDFGPPLSSQFQPLLSHQHPHPHPHPFNLVASQHFQPTSHNQHLQFPQMLHQPPPTSGQPSFGPYVHTNMPLTPMPSLPHQNTQTTSNHMPGIGGMGITLSSSYTFAPQNDVNGQCQLMHAPTVSAQASLSSGSQTTLVPSQQTNLQPSVPVGVDSATNVQACVTMQSSADWIEHTSANGRRYYYNKTTRQSSWEKPLELMTPIERADATTHWKEFTSPDGRKYYYNKVTKQSKWTIPDELKLVREQVQRGDSTVLQLENPVTSQPPISIAVSFAEPSSTSSSAVSETSSPFNVIPVAAIVAPDPVVSSGPPSIPVLPCPVTSNSRETQSPVVTLAAVSEHSGVATAMVTTTTTTSILEDVSPQGVAKSINGTSIQDLEEAEKVKEVTGDVRFTSEEDKAAEAEPFTYATKQEAKDAFKALLESSNVESDWSWEMAMRVIINDKRYGALRTLGERKQAFNEFLGLRKKQDAEERRNKQRKAREDFIKMLEESDVLTSTTKWSKAMTLFDNDERFKTVERVRDREDLYESYIGELKKKERAKAHEEHKKNVQEYKEFLQSCDFIKANSQWRKVQDRLEQDERCARLEKIDRLEIFQEYINELEKEEEELKKIQKEQLKRAERNNRDEFRKLMQEHLDAGILTANTHWREYHLKVKDSPAYLAASSNTSGATPKLLFEDIIEDLQKQYDEDKARVKFAMKLKKITMSSTWTLEDLKVAVAEELSSPPVSDINLKLLFGELLEKVKEKEDREAKKLQTLADSFSHLLYSIKEINSTSTWDDCKQLTEGCQEYRSIGEERVKREIFEEYITRLQERAREKELKRIEEKGKKEKERGERERRKDRERKEERKHGIDKEEVQFKKVETDSESVDVKEGRKKEKEKDRKHRKRRQIEGDEASTDREGRNDTTKPRKHRKDGKKSRKHVNANESDRESKSRRHKRDHRYGYGRSGAYDDLEDGELGEDGEIRTIKWLGGLTRVQQNMFARTVVGSRHTN